MGWGTTGNGPGGIVAPVAAFNLPPSLQGTAFAKVVANADFTVALTSAGKVVVLGESGLPGANVSQIPPSLNTATVTDIASSGTWVGALTSTGEVVVWGTDLDTPDPTDVPPGLSSVSKLAITGGGAAAAVKSNGDVEVWGSTGFGVQNGKPTNVGPGVKALVAGQNHYYVLKADGSVAAWGDNANGQTTLPTEVATGNVRAVESRYRGGLAILENGTPFSWGQSAVVDPDFDPFPTHGIPTSLIGKDVVTIAAEGSMNLAQERNGTITFWGDLLNEGQINEELQDLPDALEGADIAGFSFGGNFLIALVTKVLEVTKASIAGSATVGQTLTGTAATFSGGPGAVTSKWLADGVVIAGADSPTLAVTAALIGKKITYATTATKGGTEPVVSTSTPVGPVAADVVASTTTVGAAAGTYGSAAKVTVTVTGAGRPVGGNVTLSGAGAAQSAAVSGGAATFTLNKALAAGTYTMTASYSGGAGLTPSTGTARLTVAKGKSSKPAFKVNKAPTSKKKGKATVTVGAAAGLAKASSKATVTLKSGKTTKKVKVSLSGGKKSISLPKLKKGKWKIQVSYDGDKNYVAQKSKSYNLKIKK